MSGEQQPNDTAGAASWFDRARFGMFIHWGHSSLRGWELSWPLVGGTPALPSSQDVSVESYHQNALQFCPKQGSVGELVERAARARMRYAVLVSKHHDGFSLYPTRAGDFSITQSAYAGDLVREFVDACRLHGLRVGLYFSLCDWHHADYPAFRDEHRPYSYGLKPRPTGEQWERYLEFMFEQVRELLTDYGRIDVLWFDGGWERSAAQWRAKELEQMIRTLQPEILINDRLPGCGDFETPEQFIPPEAPTRRFESCLTMNESWAFNPEDSAYKSVRELVHALCEVAGRGGNLLLNVGPRADGSLPPEQAERLDALAAWMEAYGESILDTEPGLAPWQFYGPTTRKGNRIFLHLLLRPYESVTVRGLPVRRVRRVSELRSGCELQTETRCSVIDRLFNSDPRGELVIRVPEQRLDPLATVLEIEVEDRPIAD